MNNLLQIGKACRMYANEHDGRFPEDWTQLTPYFKPNSAACFISPSLRGSKPGSMTNIMEWTDYVYIRGATTSSSSSTVIAFLPTGVYPDKYGTVVLTADGEAKWQTLSEFTRAMNRFPNNTSGGTRQPSGGLAKPASDRSGGIND